MKIPGKFVPGETIAVVAPSQSGASISQEVQDIAAHRFKGMLLDVTFGKHVNEVDNFGTASIESRITDLTALPDRRCSTINPLLTIFEKYDRLCILPLLVLLLYL